VGFDCSTRSLTAVDLRQPYVEPALLLVSRNCDQVLSISATVASSSCLRSANSRLLSCTIA